MSCPPAEPSPRHHGFNQEFDAIRAVGMPRVVATRTWPAADEARWLSPARTDAAARRRARAGSRTAALRRRPRAARTAS